MNKWTVLIVFDLDGNLSSGAYIFCIHLVLSIFYISEILHLHMDYKIRVITRENVQYLTTSLTVEKHDRRKKHLWAGWRVSPNTPVTDLMDFVMTDIQCMEILWERRAKFVKSVAMASAESICMIDSVAWNCQTPEFYKLPAFLVSNITS